MAEQLAAADQARALLRVIAGPARMSKPFAMAPEVPADRVAAFRKAMAAAFADPELAEGARAGDLLLSPSDGEKVSQIVREVMTAPPDAVSRLKEILQ